MPTAIKIEVRPDNTVWAGPYRLEPSRKNWRRHRCHWRAHLNGRAVSPWCLTPRLALAAAGASAAPVPP